MIKPFVVTLLAAASLAAAEVPVSFDARVSEARRSMRASCQAVQKLPSASAAETPALERAATGSVATAVKLWTSLTEEYGKAVPEGYAGEPGWAQRLEDVRLDLVRMEREIAAREWRPAFLSCAHACTWITMMHEANGVTLAIDAMTGLRRKTGFLKGLVASHKPERARVLVKEVLAARDAVLLAPPPSGTTRDSYLAALPALSRAVDLVAETARSGGELAKPVAELSAVVERVYELAI
jgi:hypothetical protein